ncbi:MAG: 3-oxoacyl-[acyl-carrier-protein] synthase III C-terminal domain-containing protein [Gallionella sp.]
MSTVAPLRRPITLLGTGHALPQRAVLSSELDVQLGYATGTIARKSGVRSRYVAALSDTAASLAAQAAKRALRAAGLQLSDIDCLVAASGTMDQGMPCNAALIHHELGLSDSGIPAFDVNASCLGFLAALDTLSWAMMGGRYRCVLIVAADMASCGLDWSVLESSAIFGDGAAAAVVSLADESAPSALLSANLRTYSSGVDLCKIPAGGTRYHPTRIQQPFEPLAKFKMDGKGVFKLALVHLPDFVAQLLAQAGITAAQLDWIVPHQASHLALAHLTKRLGFPVEKVINIFAEHGNQVAASLPTALDIAIRDGRIQRGQRVLLLGTGAGLSIGGIVLVF